MQALTVSLIQADLVWEDKAANLRFLEEQIAALPAETQLVVLPEMFSTGFSMHPNLLAELMDGHTVKWMQTIAAKYRKIVTGSLIIEEEGKYFNRLIWMQPDGRFYHYDKRHMFSYAGEDKVFTPGEKKLIVQVNGWKVCLMVCYDLRFPVWSRQTVEPYDVLIYVANWPERRNHAWKTLLQARAIENQCFVIGVNRVGLDGNKINHSGDSCLIDPFGQYIGFLNAGAANFTHSLNKEDLLNCRNQFPFLNEADRFLIL